MSHEERWHLMKKLWIFPLLFFVVGIVPAHSNIDFDRFFLKYQDAVRSILQYGGLMKRQDDALRSYPLQEVSGYVEPGRQ